MGHLSLPVVAVACVLLVGCLSGVPGAETHRTPTPTGEDCRELPPRETPEPPAKLTRQSAISYSNAYTNISHWNDQFAGDEYVRVDIDTTGFVVNQTDTGFIVHVGRQVSTLDCDGTHGDPSQFGFGYDYFINDSLLAVNYTGIGVRNGTVHPRVGVEEILRNGSVVEQWNQT